MTFNSELLIYTLDLIGTAAFAVSGAVRGLQRRPDLVGLTILAGATAVGGGVVRDVMLGRRAAMLDDWRYPLVILLAVVPVYLLPRLFLRREAVLKHFDAVGLGIFSAIGGTLAMDQGYNPLSVLFIAAITGAGGGVIRDVLLTEPPLVLYREIYILAVLAGAAAMMLARYAGAGRGAGFLAALAVTMLLRMLAIRGNWTLPRVGPGT